MSLLEHLGRKLIAELVPDDWASYAPLIADGLHRFVECLPAHRRAEIANRQAALPLDAIISERLVVLFQCCPTLHKLGQMVARDQRLPVELRNRLCELEVMAPRTSMVAVMEIVRDELGDLSRFGVECAGELLAEGSVAVVLPFVWRDGDEGEDVAGVFKILKPGIERRLEEDLNAWTELGGFLEDRMVGCGLAMSSVREMLNDVCELLSHEVRLDIEQENIEVARAQFEHDNDVIIPRLLPFCTLRITAMQRLAGVPLTSCIGLSDDQRRRMADIVVRCCLATPMWTTRETALFHGDPHAGNWLVMEGDHQEFRMGMLDWALAERSSRFNRKAMADLVMSTAIGDCTTVMAALSELGAKFTDACGVKAMLRGLMGGIHARSSPKFTDTILLLDTVAQNTSVHLPGGLLVIRKSLLTLRGMVEHFSPGFNLDDAMLSHGFSQLFEDWLRGSWVLPWQRGAYSHVSTADLWRLVISRTWGLGNPFAPASF